MTKKHAKLSASGSSRWMNCPGSIKAEEDFRESNGIVERSNFFADEGSVAHELAELSLTQEKHPSHWLNETFEDWPDIPVNQEMVDNVAIYCDFINSLPGVKIIEERVDFSDWVPDGFGTSDAIIIGDDSIHVVDLKYGKGVAVSPENNSQGMLYALGACALFRDLYPIERVMITIVQPRLDHIETWETTLENLFKFGNEVSIKAEQALSDDAPRVPGESQCRWCDAKVVCPALNKLTEESVLCHFDNEMESLSDEDLKQALDNKKLIVGWLDSVEAHVKKRIVDGDSFPGYKLVRGRSSRSWFDEQVTIEALSNVMSEDDIFTKKLITPPQAEKKLGKVIARDIQDLIVVSDGKPTLVKESDKRESMNVSTEDFD